MYTLIATIALILFISAACSGTEAAVLSFPRNRLAVLRRHARRGTAQLLALYDHLPQTISTVVILNNLATIVGSIVIGSLAARLLNDTATGILSAAFTFFVIVFSEVLPKAIGEYYSQRVVPLVAMPLRGLVIVFSPVTWLISQLTRLFTKRTRPTFQTSEEEIRLLTSIGRKAGAIEEDEAHMVHRVFRLNDLTAKDLMTPRSEVQAFESNLSLRDIPESQLDDAYSRVLVIGVNLDDIRGVVLKDAVLGHLADDLHHLTVGDLAVDALLVAPDMRADDLVRFFQKKRQHLAVVRSEDGKTIGVVTLEDVLEEIVGEIEDETDERPRRK